jgi:ATP-binding cassette subfamily B protein
VDNETEAAIQRSMERLGQGRTVIIIAHRLSTVRNADRIYVLEGGAVSDVGTHEELVVRDGLYRALWRVQTGERGRPAPGPPEPGEPNPGRSGRHGPDTRR